jgi:hypothetical protein
MDPLDYYKFELSMFSMNFVLCALPLLICVPYDLASFPALWAISENRILVISLIGSSVVHFVFYMIRGDILSLKPKQEHEEMAQGFDLQQSNQ